jgi:hydroxymethylglutaryl-CoA reductase (NADPH)
MDPVQKGAPETEGLIEEIVEGRRRLHELPAGLSAVQAAEVRRRALERIHGVSLGKVGDYSLDAARASARHCENFIGAAQIPIGIAGPVRLRGAHVSGDEEIFVPLATTEGALVASVNRGCRALRLAGGAVAWVEDVGMTRAPVFRTSGIEQTREFLRYVAEHEAEIAELASSTSRHLELVEIRPQAFGTSVYLRFRFRSGDAMGMNMATIACDKVVRELIEPATGVTCIALSGNLCVDKKPSTINFLEGRGKRAHAEVVLEASVLEECLRTNAGALVEAQYRKNLLGSITAGSLGFNAHYANVLAAFFIATGQDVAQVAEAAMGITCIEPRGADGVYASVYLPDLPLGAVGGGTGLDTQKEILALLGVAAVPGGHGEASMRLAEILSAAVLASELSLMSALTSGDLAPAHERLGRAPLAD